MPVDMPVDRSIEIAKRRDRWARYAITGGGGLVVLAIIGIFVEIAAVTAPLFAGASAAALTTVPLSPGQRWLAAGADNDGQILWALEASGEMTIVPVGPAPFAAIPVALAPPAPGATIVRVDRAAHDTLLVAWSDGTVSFERLTFTPRFDANDRRTIEPRVTRFGAIRGSAGDPAAAPAVAPLADGYVAAWPGAAAIQVERSRQRENLLGEVTIEHRRDMIVLPEPAAAWRDLRVDTQGRHLYAADARGTLRRWVLGDDTAPDLLDEVTALAGPVARLGLLLGDVSLVVAGDDGSVAVWFPTRGAGDASSRLTRVHALPSSGAAAVAFAAAPLNRAFALADRQGGLSVYHATSATRVITIAVGEPLTDLAWNGRGDVLTALGDSGRVHAFRIHAPHPEATLGTLFGKVWYEGYDAPAWVWQSTGGTVDFEPKLSLVPLIVGTLKATLYAMLFSVPLALLAAICTSQFLGERMRQVIKPTVELMAAFPSVVIGFVAALWLAPIVEEWVVGLLLILLVLPLMVLLWLVGWSRIERRRPRLAARRGLEFIMLLPALVAAVALSLALGAAVERGALGGSFGQWLFDGFGVRLDQRNSIVIAVALGFAVVPIVFTIAEDALGNVPRSLTAASLAMGASRWQTVWNVVLPSTSPGVFAAIMIGFGRAVGETMIVLMAAGNTPILDWAPWNGMRTLSANVAVEIPEAPAGGTLYRVLFLSGLLLFALTFVANTAAELVRNRLRERYGRF